MARLAGDAALFSASDFRREKSQALDRRTDANATGAGGIFHSRGRDIADEDLRERRVDVLPHQNPATGLHE